MESNPPEPSIGLWRFPLAVVVALEPATMHDLAAQRASAHSARPDSAHVETVPRPVLLLLLPDPHQRQYPEKGALQLLLRFFGDVVNTKKGM